MADNLWYNHAMLDWEFCQGKDITKYAMLGGLKPRPMADILHHIRNSFLPHEYHKQIRYLVYRGGVYLRYYGSCGGALAWADQIEVKYG